MALVALSGFALLALPVAARHPGRTFLATLLLAMFSAPLEQLSGIAQFSTLDEVAPVYAVTTCLLARTLSGQQLRLPFGAALFGVFILAGLASGIPGGVPSVITAGGLLGMTKGFLFGIAACQLDVSGQMFDRSLRLGCKLMLVVAACILLNMAAPTLWTSLLIEPGANVTGPLWGQPLVGPFTRPAALGRLCMMAALVCMAYSVRRRWTLPVTAMVGLLVVSVLIIGQSKSIIALGVGIVVILIQLRHRPLALAGAYALAAGLVVAGAPLVSGITQDISRYSADTSARSLLAAGSAELAAREFPLGVGFGRFASPTAAQYYSPYYTELGFENRFGLSPHQSAYLTDTAWPAILGESGWLGASAFAGALLVILIKTSRVMKQRLPDRTHLLALSTLLLVLASVVESSSGPVFTSAPSFPLMWVAVGLLTGTVRGPGPDAVLDKTVTAAHRRLRRDHGSLKSRRSVASNREPPII